VVSGAFFPRLTIRRGTAYLSRGFASLIKIIAYFAITAIIVKIAETTLGINLTYVPSKIAIFYGVAIAVALAMVRFSSPVHASRHKALITILIGTAVSIADAGRC